MSKQDKVTLTCPRCGHQQPEPATAFSAVCKKCGQYLRVQEVLKPERKAVASEPERRLITCFDCGTELFVAVGAQSTMCKKCSRHIDLLDHNIATAVSKNFKSKGTFVIQSKGYVFNSEAIVGEAVIRGRFLGKLIVEGTLTIYSTALIKGSFTAGRLLIPQGNVFRWPERIEVQTVEVAGELIANLHVGSILVKPTGRLFGNVEARYLSSEDGGVVVGDARISPQIQVHPVRL